MTGHDEKKGKSGREPYRDGFDRDDPLNPLNAKAVPKVARQTAVAIIDDKTKAHPIIAAAGRGAVAQKILDLAFANGIKVREDADLAEILAKFELDSPIPTEALMAVGEILAYVHQANGEPDPFDAVLKDTMEEGETGNDTQ